MSDQLGDRLKSYEPSEKLIRSLPIIARLDGKCFHNFTKNFEKPFDPYFVSAMGNVTKWLVEETNACMGYTQSDEITLTWYTKENSEMLFNGKIFKLTSVLASMCTSKFNTYYSRLAFFDCRVFNVPTKIEGSNVFLWREQDATKNAISMAASIMYSAKELLNKNSKQKQEMLFQKGINFNGYPFSFKRGTYFQRRTNVQKFTKEENLPEKHEARLNPDLIFERSRVECLDMPIFIKVKNRAEVVYDGVNPEI